MYQLILMLGEALMKNVGKYELKFSKKSFLRPSCEFYLF